MIIGNNYYNNKKWKKDGSCLATLLMPGGVAGFPALRFLQPDFRCYKQHLVIFTFQDFFSTIVITILL